MATNNLKTILDEAKKTAGEFSNWSHLNKHRMRDVFAGVRTIAPRTQASVVKSLNALLKSSYTVEQVFPSKKDIRAAKVESNYQRYFSAEGQKARKDREAERTRRLSEAEARKAAYLAKKA
jgi:hypothetical protein